MGTMTLSTVATSPTWKGINSDSARFLAYFLPKGGKLDMGTARSIARSLHLAFKGMDSGEVYDVLMQQFLIAAAKYDPGYTEKVKRVAGCIDHELSKYKQIRVVDVNRHLELNGDRYLRKLSSRGFLEPVKEKGGKISGWVRSGKWPPPAGFFESGPVGFAYYVQTWFRYYLQQWIEKRQGELETQLPPGIRLRASNENGVFLREGSEELVPSHAKSLNLPPALNYPQRRWPGEMTALITITGEEAGGPPPDPTPSPSGNLHSSFAAACANENSFPRRSSQPENSTSSLPG